MKPNVGNLDKYIRIVLGIIIIAFGIFYSSWWGLIGVVPIFTAFMRWCPLYAPFGICTIKNQKST